MIIIAKEKNHLYLYIGPELSEMLICIQKFIQNKYKEMPPQMSSGIWPFGKRLWVKGT